MIIIIMQITVKARNNCLFTSPSKLPNKQYAKITTALMFIITISNKLELILFCKNFKPFFNRFIFDILQIIIDNIIEIITMHTILLFIFSKFLITYVMPVAIVNKIKQIETPIIDESIPVPI